MVRVVTFTDQNVLIASLSDLNRQCQDFFLGWRVLVSGCGGASRRTLVVLAHGSRVVQVGEVVVLQIIQIARQP